MFGILCELLSLLGCVLVIGLILVAISIFAFILKGLFLLIVFGKKPVKKGENKYAKK